MWQCQLNPMRRYGTSTLALSSSLYFLRVKICGVESALSQKCAFSISKSNQPARKILPYFML